MNIIQINGHTLIDNLIDKNSTIIDLGANLGNFSKIISLKYMCSVHSVEASPITFKKTYSSEIVQKYNFAVCRENQTIEFNLSDNPEASSLYKLQNTNYIESVLVEGITLKDFLNKHSIVSPDTLKLDVEGAEIEILNYTSPEILKSFRQITVEFHEWLGIGSKDDVKKVISRMKKIGFYYFKNSRTNHGDDLFINSSSVTLPEYYHILTMIFFGKLKKQYQRFISKL